MSTPPRGPDRDLAAALGASCRRARLESGWSQEATAERISVCTEFYGRVERGRALPALNTIVRMAHVLGISLDEVRSHVVLGRRERRPPETAEPAPAETGVQSDTQRKP